MRDKILSNINPRVSVIMACLNSQKHIERVMASLLAQTYGNIEHIVIDGGSADDTLKILDKYKHKIAYLSSEPDQGIYDAMNKGIRHSTGGILYFLNTDDRLYDKDVIKDVVDFFSRKETDFVYGDIVNFHPGTFASSIGRYPKFVTKRHFLKNTIGHPATFFKRRCFDAAGLYDIRYKIVSDYEWYLRGLYKHNLRCVHIDRIISVFQCSGASMTQANLGRIASERKAAQELYFKPSEIRIGKFVNFFFYLDFIRVAARFILGRRAYGFIAGCKKKAVING